jgi:fructose-1,6-bisphosphatase
VPRYCKLNAVFTTKTCTEYFISSVKDLYKTFQKVLRRRKKEREREKEKREKERETIIKKDIKNIKILIPFSNYNLIEWGKLWVECPKHGKVS